MDQYNVRLEDPELLDEVEMTADLIVAANQSEQPMSASEIDSILGVHGGPHPGHDDVVAS